MLRGILFDFGGVLTYTCWDLRDMSNTIIKTLSEYGIEAPANFYEIFVQVMQAAWDRVVKTLLEEKMEVLISEALYKAKIEPQRNMIDTIMDRILDAPFCIVRDDAYYTLSTLKKIGMKIAVVSNAPMNFHKRVLDRANLSGFVDEIIVSCDVGYRKPHPKIYEIALNKLNVNPTDAVFVGDVLEIDILGARKMGMKTILMRVPEPAMNDLPVPKLDEDIDPDFIIEELSEVVDIIMKLN